MPLPSTERSFTDLGPLEEGQLYVYDLRSVDNAGVESRPNLRVITPGDTEPPPAVTNLQGEWTVSSVFIYWTKPTLPPLSDLVGYSVWRRIPPTGGYTYLATVPPSAGAYMDSTAVEGTTYTYKVESLDSAQLVSYPNPIVTVQPDPEGGGGGGGGGGGSCPPTGCPGGEGGSLLLPPCRGDRSEEQDLISLPSFCFPGEMPVWLADHDPEEIDYRIIFLHVDHLGTPRVITDEAGGVLTEHAFFPYGEEVPGLHSTWDSTNTHWFTGHERDGITGWDDMLARDYTSLLARFVLSDPIKAGTGMYGYGSLYVYGNDSPLTYIDPSGNSAKSVLWCLGAALGGAGTLLGATGTAVAAIGASVAPEPLVTKATAVGLFGATVGLLSWTAYFSDSCAEALRVDRLQKTIDDCVNTGTRKTCEEAVEICNYDKKLQFNQLENCAEAERRLRELERQEQQQEEPCPPQPPLQGSLFYDSGIPIPCSTGVLQPAL
jgi:RHS repeat-associated protein